MARGPRLRECRRERRTGEEVVVRHQLEARLGRAHGAIMDAAAVRISSVLGRAGRRRAHRAAVTCLAVCEDDRCGAA
jgi:hypothetical protein